MDKIEIETIKEIITELLEIMDFQGRINVDTTNESNILVNIQTDQASFLIGQAGANLEALQYIARVLASKKIGAPVQFILDVNDYQKHHIELLEELAKNIAKQALSERIAVTLQPMPAFKRRIVHLALADNSQISTESVGQEPERRIVVKPIK